MKLSASEIKFTNDKNIYDKNITAIILCAGSSTRSQLDYNKVFYLINDKTALEHSLTNFINASVYNFVITYKEEEKENFTKTINSFKNTLSFNINISLVKGGNTRTESVKNALAKVDKDCDIVSIHDGARPFATKDVIENSINSAIRFDSGISCVKTIDTIKEATNNFVTKTLNRDILYNVQTPQSFNYSKIKYAYSKIDKDIIYFDDSQVYENSNFISYISEGSYDNKKLTTIEDFSITPPLVDTNNILSTNMLKNFETESIKIGTGFDVHKLVENRDLILGGCKIEHYKGLLGHSDADVLTHAIMDALLNACGMRDIGTLFPDTDNSYKNADSIELLKKVKSLMDIDGYKIINISAVIMAQKPKINPHILNMRKMLCLALNISDLEKVNISATTTENLGIVGEEKGIACHASCLVYK